MKNENKNMKLFTSIIAPISILATNSLIGQIFHLQFDVYGLLFISMIMFMPIAFIIRNYLSLTIYGVGAVIISFYVETVFNNLILLIPLFVYYIYNYIKHREDKKNTLLWTFNAIIITIILFSNSILRGEISLLYLYVLSLVTKLLFDDKNKLNKTLSVLFMIYLIISCISSSMFEIFNEIKFGADTAIFMLISLVLFVLTKEYRKVEKYFILVFIMLLHCTILSPKVLYVLVNLITLSYGIYKIINGRRINSYRIIKQGVALILYLIFIRFMSAEISFRAKSILFLISGIIFIIGSKIFKNKIEEEKKDE